jgi:hypothetical protein
MFQLGSDKSKNLLTMSFSGHVAPAETHEWRERLVVLVGELRPGLKLLNDMSALDSMDRGCMPDFEFGMELLDKSGIAKVVRILKDPRKDIGLNILSLFHYHHRIPIVNCETMEEALSALAD